MFSRFKHIFHFLLVVAMLMSITSCARWREGKEVVVEADGLFAKGVIMKDTAALAEVIRTLEPYGRLIAREDLVKAYYLLGRNMDDYYHDFSTAADYYIEADRLNTKDPILRGRKTHAWDFCVNKIVVLRRHWSFICVQAVHLKRVETNGTMHIIC